MACNGRAKKIIIVYLPRLTIQDETFKMNSQASYFLSKISRFGILSKVLDFIVSNSGLSME
jgi:hypothetical protein